MNYKQMVYDRFSEIVPVENLENLDILEVKKSLKIAWEIIGYSPKNLEKSFKKVWENSEATSLFEFIYEVWEEDYDGDGS